MDRSWTFEFQMHNYQKKKYEAWVEPIKDWYIFKGDRVSFQAQPLQSSTKLFINAIFFCN